MKQFVTAIIFTAFVVFTLNAEARSSSSRYSMYGYGGSSSQYKSYGYGSSSSNYEGFRTNRASGHNDNYWRQGKSHQRYNDPTGKRIITISAPNPALPSGNYGRGVNRLRGTY